MLEKLIALNHGSKWRTTPLYEALQEAFGHKPIFSGNGSDSRKYGTKVAVISTSQSDCRPLVITNYNREESSDPGHSLELSADPRNVLKAWEAAAATSAAPSFFKPSECRGKTYLDRALNYNNPVFIAWREKKLIWLDVPSTGLDILVSAGTGQNENEIDTKLKKAGATNSKRNSADKDSAGTKDARKSAGRYTAWNGLKNYFSVLVNKLDKILDTERTWHDFVGDVVGEHWSTEDSARYVRLNPDLRYPPPALDEKYRLLELQRRVRALLQSDTHLIRTVEDIANRLFASSFYFKKLKIEADLNTFTCSGSLRSKFDGKPKYIEQIGRFLKNQLLGDFAPKFVVSRRLSSADAQSYDSIERYESVMDMEFINNMITKKEFDLDKTFDIEVTKRDEPMYVCLRLRLDNPEGKVVVKDYPISGFPRRFLVEKERSTSRLQKRKADMERFRSRQKMGASDGETNNTTSSGVNRPPSSGLVRTASPTLTRSGSGSTGPPTGYHSLSDAKYDSEYEAERQMMRLKMVDSSVPAE